MISYEVTAFGEPLVRAERETDKIDAADKTAIDAAVVPSNMTEVSSLITSAMKMIQTTQRGN